VFDGRLKVLPHGHPLWLWPILWEGAEEPVLGAGQPSIIFVGHMAEHFLADRPQAAMDRAADTLAASKHIGLFVTKCATQMMEYFTDPRLSPERLALWKSKFWLGFSAERQREFDLRWPPMKALAERGWFVFADLAPLLAPISLPPDALKVLRWVIVSGDQDPDPHDMDPDWARAVRDQCRAAGIPFFIKQMAGKRAIPIDLDIREFPPIGTAKGKAPSVVSGRG
jgi:protein gp37